jgi:hypothetical protein
MFSFERPWENTAWNRDGVLSPGSPYIVMKFPPLDLALDGGLREAEGGREKPALKYGAEPCAESL